MNISLIFKFSNGNIEKYCVDKYSTIRELQQRYYLGDFQIYKNQKLERNKTLAEYNMKNHDVITCYIMESEYSGVSKLNIVDNKTKNIGFDTSAPHYRQVTNGLNALSICLNKDCIAYNKSIYVKIGRVKNWNLFDNMDKIRCPECKQTCQPKNFGFYDCKYEIAFYIFDNGDYGKETVHGLSGEKEFKLFEDESKMKASFSFLLFNID